MIQVYKEVFKARATSLRARRLAECLYVVSTLNVLINVYRTLFFIITALQSENYNKKKEIETYTFSEVICVINR
jgi:hypothetical protein